MTDKNKLNVIDEKGNITGIATRESIHANGLLHKEIHVWFYTPNGGIIFQHRAKNTDTYPDLLDATVGGHVEIGSDFDTTALREIEEETGIQAIKENLEFIHMVRSNTHDAITGKTNNVLRAVYAYRFDGAIEKLKIEKRNGLGFELWTLDTILHISFSHKKRFIPAMFDKEMLDIFIKIKLRL